MTENDLYESAQLLSADTLNLIGCKAILEQERVVIERQIGAGNFGKVYKGTSYSSYSSKRFLHPRIFKSYDLHEHTHIHTD